MDNVIKMNIVFFGVVCIVAFLVLIAISVIACVAFLQKYMNTHIAILVVSFVTIELIIFGISFAEYLIGG